MNARAALMGGMGFPATETPWGMPQLKTRLEAIGVQVLLVSWSARQEVFNFLYSFAGKKIYAGDSLGAGSAGQYPGDIRVPVDYAAGFQPSMDDERTKVIKPGLGEQLIADNIVKAHCIYDPLWADTLGLGQAQWISNKKNLLVTQHRGAHPDDWGWSQDLIFNEIKGIVG